MKKFYLHIFFSIFLLPIANLFPQAYHFQTLLSDQGQAIKQVRTMFQDSKGFLWIGSSGGGVCRYDGKNYVIYTRKNGLCSDDVNCIAEDLNGNLWFGTAAGISMFSNGVFKNFPEEIELNKSSVFAITEDSEKNLWFGTSVGAYKYSENKFMHYTEKDGLPNNFIRTILLDKSGKLWFGTVNGKIFLYENNSFKEINVVVKSKDFISAERLDVSENAGEDDKIGNNLIWSMYEDSKGIIWIGVDDGLWMGKMENGEWKMEKTPLEGNSILSICEDEKENLWIGTGEIGIWKYDGEEFINFNEKHGLASNLIYSIVRDREGNMWFGGYGTGISKTNILSYEIYNKQKEFPQSFIWTVKEDFDGNIWAGFYQPGISVILNPDDFNKKEILNFSTEGLVYYIFFENATTLWCATINGIEIYHWDKTKKKLTFKRRIDKTNGLAGNIVRYIYKDSKNNLWITTAFGISLMQKNGSEYQVTKSFTDKDGLVNNYVFSVLENGDYWFTTAGGISRFDGKNFQNYTPTNDTTDSEKKKAILDYSLLRVSAVSEGLANHDVRSVVKDNRGTLWFATGAGISYYDERYDNFKSVTSQDGLSVDRLYFLQYDSIRNSLWIGSAFGLDKFDLEEFYKTGKKVFSHPKQYDGFIEVETNTNAVCMDKKGHLWLGTIDGLIKYFPDFIRQKNKLEPLTHITNVSVNRKDTVLNSILPYDFNNLGFQFIGISLSMPERVQYSYMLEGFDDDWSEPSEQTMLAYSNLPSGNFTLKVIACNNDGVWNEKPTVFSFFIAPPWWQRWWFRICVIIFVICIIFFYIKWRERNLQKEKEILEEKVALRTSELAEEKEKVEEKNKEITDSILYAKRIQTALLTSEKYLQQHLPEHFIFFKPKDIVSGDFYWAHAVDSKNHQVILALADCTGHGVPGAFMSMIGINKLNEIIIQKKIYRPDTILNMLREEIILALNPDEVDGQTDDENYMDVKDGMDIALCRLTTDDRRQTAVTSGIRIEYVGANNPLWIVRRGEKFLTEINADIFPVGKHRGATKPFSLKTIEVQHGDMIYLFSDGYADQFGGPKGKKFKHAKLKETLLSISNAPVEEQKQTISDIFEQWKGDLIQVDDICVVGLRV